MQSACCVFPGTYDTYETRTDVSDWGSDLLAFFAGQFNPAEITASTRLENELEVYVLCDSGNRGLLNPFESIEFCTAVLCKTYKGSWSVFVGSTPNKFHRT